MKSNLILGVVALSSALVFSGALFAENPNEVYEKAKSSNPTTSPSSLVKANQAKVPPPIPINREYLYIYGMQQNSASVLVQIDSFTAIEIMENDNDWIKVRTKIGLPVWVKTIALDRVGDYATLKESATIRSIPLENAQTITGKLNKGDNCKIVQEHDEWSQVLTPNNFEAWINKKELIDFESKSGISTQEFVKKIPDLSKRLNGVSNTLRNSPQAKAKLEKKSIKQSNATLINVYTNTDSNRQLIKQISINSELKLSSFKKTKNDTTWVKVNSKKGFPVWVHTDFLMQNSEFAKITSNIVNARTEPRIKKGTIVGKLYKGDSLKILKKQEDWIQVISPKRFYGWVKENEI